MLPFQAWPLAAAAVFSLASCSAPETDLVALAQKAVSQQMKDPGSAEFTNTFIVPKPPGSDGLREVSVCGTVSGKNSTGTMASGMRFAVINIQSMDQKKVQIADVAVDNGDRRATVDTRKTDKPESAFDTIYWNKYCTDAAHPPVYSGVR